MLNDLEASLLRNLENRRQRVIDTQNTLVGKLGVAVEHMEQCGEGVRAGTLTKDLLALTVVKWYEVLTVLEERTANECAEFTRLAADMDPEEMEEHEPGGYISQRLNLLTAARNLSVRNLMLGDTIAAVFAGWLKVAGVDTANNDASPNKPMP